MSRCFPSGGMVSRNFGAMAVPLGGKGHGSTLPGGSRKSGKQEGPIPMPDDALQALDDDPLANVVEESESGGGGSLFALLSYWHPVLLLVLALSTAATAYILMPEDATETVPPIESFYESALESLLQAQDPLNSLSDTEIRDRIALAKQALDFLFSHPLYGREVRRRPDFINPHMLYADTLRLYAPYRPTDRRDVLEQAIQQYGEALEWMDRRWSDAGEMTHRRQFQQAPDARFDTEEYEIRRRRRRHYLEYHRAATMVETGSLTRARQMLENLLAAYRVEDLAADARLGQATRTARRDAPRTYPPLPFEITPEDRNRTHFHLARIHDMQNEPEKAEALYRIFLLQAPRSAERFEALRRLGEMYLDRAYENQPTAPALARRMFDAAAEQYKELIRASAPSPLLQEAYFHAGRAYVGVAETFPRQEETIWDGMDRTGERVRGGVETLFPGARIPERTRRLPLALGRQMLFSGIDLPDPTGAPVLSLAGLGLALAGEERQTQLSRIRRDLTQARNFFRGTAIGAETGLHGDAKVMEARTFMIEGQYDLARERFQETMRNFYNPAVEIACRLGIAESFFREGELDRARVRFLGGVEKEGSALLVRDDFPLGWIELCHQIARAAGDPDAVRIHRVQAFLPERVRERIAQVALTSRLPQRFERILLSGFNDLLDREDFYDPAVFPPATLSEEARILLQTPIELLRPDERHWLNRMLLDMTFPTYILPVSKGTRFAPFPADNELPTSPLIRPAHIQRTLQTLAEAFIQRADEERDAIDRINPTPPDEATARTRAARPRRALRDANELFSYLFTHHNPRDPALVFRAAGIMGERAHLAAAHPFVDMPRARALMAESARTYLEAARMAGDDEVLEADALLLAGQNFYAAGQYGRATEALSAFARRFPGSDRVGRARNLKGIAYRQLGNLREAERVFRDNSIPRYVGDLAPGARIHRTNEQWKALYYLGEVLQAQPDRVGNPEEPYPPEVHGVIRVNAALQAFNYIRQAEGITPDARPWQWATFALGQTLYQIAEAQREALRPQGRVPTQADAVAWLPFFRSAEAVLREGLERYPLGEEGEGDLGVEAEDQPEEYRQRRWQRLMGQYYLARVLREQARWREDRDEVEARRMLREILDPARYPDAMFDPEERRNILADRPVPGINEGPEPKRAVLRHLQRNAFFILGQSYYEEGLALDEARDRAGAEAAYEEALRVYRLAASRLPPTEDPAISFYIAETLTRLRRFDEARRQYQMAVDEANRQIETGIGDREDDHRRWIRLAQERLDDRRYVEGL